MTSERYIQDIPTLAELSEEIVAALRVLLPDWTPDVTDPGVRWADDTSSRLIALMQAFNASADANYLLRARGQALRELLLSWGVYDVPAGQSRDDSLQAVRDLWSAITAGTDAWDILQAHEASDMVADAARATPDTADWAANRTRIYVLNAMGENLAPSERAAVQAHLNRSERPTFWTTYFVGEVGIERYLVTGTVIYDEQLGNPRTTVEANLEAALSDLRKLNRGIDDSVLIERMWAPAVRRIDLQIVSATLTGDTYSPGSSKNMPPAPNRVYHGVYKAKTGAETTYPALDVRPNW